MKRIIVASIMLMVVAACSGTSKSKGSGTSFPLSCDRENPKGAGHSTYGIPQLWSCE